VIKTKIKQINSAVDARMSVRKRICCHAVCRGRLFQHLFLY